MALVLHGGNTENDLELKRSEVNHLRLMLAWLRLEYMLDEDMQAGYAKTAAEMVRLGLSTEEQGRQLLAEKAAEIRHVPLYVRQAVKMLTKRIRDHDKAGDIADGEVMKNRLATPTAPPSS